MENRRGDIHDAHIYDTRKNKITNTGRDKSCPYILIAITFLVYINSLPNDFIFDDLPLVQNSISVLHGGFWELMKSYRPLRYLSYALDYHIFGMHPWGFRSMNIFYHALTVISLFWMLKIFGLSRKASFISALIFAIHPVNTDAVAYISGRRDVLMGLFYVLSLGCFMKFYNNSPDPSLKKRGIIAPSILKREGGGRVLKKRYFYLFLSLIFMFLSISSKEMGATIPLIFILYIFYKDGPKIFKSRWIHIILMSFLLLFVFFVFVTISGGGSSLVSLHGIRFHGNSPEVHYLTATTIWLHYLELTVFPLKLILDNAGYPLVLDWNFLVFFSICSMFIYGWIVWKLATQPTTPSLVPKDPPLITPQSLDKGALKSVAGFSPCPVKGRDGKGFNMLSLSKKEAPSELHAIAFWMVFFVISLAPVLQIIPLHEIVAVHYLYIPVIGFCAIIGILVDMYKLDNSLNPSLKKREIGKFPLFVKERAEGELLIKTPSLCEREGRGELYHSLIIFFLILLLSFFSIRTITRNFELKDIWTAIHADEKWQPLSFRGYFTIGAEYLNMKFPDKAWEYYQKALNTGAWDPNLLGNIVGYYIVKGEHAAALEFYEEMVKKGEYITSQGMLNAAVLYMLAGDCDKAVNMATSFAPLANQVTRIELVKKCTDYEFDKYDEDSISDIFHKQEQMKELGLEVERKPYLKMLIAANNSTPQPPLFMKERVGESFFDQDQLISLIHELSVIDLQSDIPEAIKYYKLEKELYQKSNKPVPEIVEKSIAVLEDYQYKVLVEGKYYKLEW